MKNIGQYLELIAVIIPTPLSLNLRVVEDAYYEKVTKRNILKSSASLFDS